MSPWLLDRETSSRFNGKSQSLIKAAAIYFTRVWYVPQFLHNRAEVPTRLAALSCYFFVVLLQLFFLFHINKYKRTHTLARHSIFLLYIELPEHRILYFHWFSFFRLIKMHLILKLQFVKRQLKPILDHSERFHFFFFAYFSLDIQITKTLTHLFSRCT